VTGLARLLMVLAGLAVIGVGVYVMLRPKAPAAVPSTSELPPAAQPPSAAAGPLLDASVLLGDSARLAFLPPGTARQHLQGAASTPTYDGLQLKPPSSADLGLTVQWWRLPSAAEAQSRYDKNLSGYGTILPVKDEVGTHSFRATGYQHRSLVFEDAGSGSVVALNCGEATCVGQAGDDELLAVAKSILTHLGH
jgi:hypothetical protein